jgi:CheY-like chemotaxis protein
MAKVLVIDDDQSIRVVFSRFLAGNGYEVACAEDGREGLSKLASFSPDVVVTDIMMPSVDGLELVLAMRDKYPEVPVIAISGGMQTVPLDLLPMVEKFGARRIFYKPVELADLLTAVKEVTGE